MSAGAESQGKYSILWFRHGLRLHDNPSLHAAIFGDVDNYLKLLPIFIFDGETAGTSLCGYNRMSYLLECLSELNDRFRCLGSRLHIFKYVFTAQFLASSYIMNSIRDEIP